MSSSSEEEEVDDDGAIGSGDEDALHGMVRGVGGMDEDEGLHWTELPHAYKGKHYDELKALCEARKPPVSSKRPNKDIMQRLLIHDFKHNHERWDGKHNDSCEVCNKTGTLGCCFFCNVVLHPKCMPEPQKEVPKSRLRCHSCLAEELAHEQQCSSGKGKAAATPVCEPWYHL